MSNIYLSEPPTSGKVLIHTNFGDIDVELWSKECPLACRNFVQHCVDGYYNNNIFHRVIKDFMAQTGDPTNTGKGGESIWGRPFKDEIHGRIKFNHRGQVACANEQEPNSNHSQFFMTFGACEWLDKKHTIFGKVTGNTIFNLLRIGDADVDQADKPLEDITITYIEVLWNPFDDIVPSSAAVQATTAADMKNAASAAGKHARKSTKDNKLLSFGDEEEEEEEDTVGLAAALAKKRRAAATSSSSSSSKHTNEAEEMTASRVSAPLGKRRADELTNTSNGNGIRSAGNSGSATVEVETTTMKIARMKQELACSLTEAEPAFIPVTDASSSSSGKNTAGAGSLLEQQRARYSGHGNGNSSGAKKLKRGDEGYEEAMLAKLSAFSSKVATQSWAR